MGSRTPLPEFDVRARSRLRIVPTIEGLMDTGAVTALSA